jgi:hypothetical protein
MLVSMSSTEVHVEANQRSAVHPNLRLAVLLFAVIYTTAFWLLALMLAVCAFGIHASNTFFFSAALVIALLAYAALALILRGAGCARPLEERAG